MSERIRYNEVGVRRLVTEVWKLVDDLVISSRSPAADAALDLRDEIDTNWHPTEGRPPQTLPGSIPPHVDACPSVFMEGRDVIQVWTHQGWLNVYAGHPPT